MSVDIPRYVIVAVNASDALDYADRQGIPRSRCRAITPRSEHAARGYAADEVHVTVNAMRLPPDSLTRLRTLAECCLALRGRHP